MSHPEDTGSEKLSEFPRETSQNALNGADVNLEAKRVRRKWFGKSDAKFVHAKALWSYG